jgi:hypothetical protein
MWSCFKAIYSVLILMLGHVHIKHKATASSSLPHGNEEVAGFVIRPQAFKKFPRIL